ncbi:MFS transporter [Actinomadura sp. DC4]|uniref:MFS transporter n=1 Tax=Actinomadura sp. DC4 TaxID=3055069 RepID=UPI0025AF5DAF|nr:MFS transporter [Actinomadura sp. DC4]MDN3356195.1 MFS transporter [Actinomadura sp. DC4]
MSPPSHRRRLLAVLLIGQFMANIDVAIVNVAGPAIRHGLHASGGALEFVVSGYTLAYAVLLVTGARLGDTRGHRRMFLAGLGGFTLASLACGLAPEEYTLIVARILQGSAAALMVPQVLSGIHVHFSGPARARAQAMLVLALSGGAVAGQVLGGVLVSADLFGLGWRPVFLINVPIGVLLLAAGARVLPADRGGAAKRLDLGGVALLSAAVLLAVVPLVFGRDLHWPAWTWVSMAASVPVLAAFVGRQRRVASRGGDPLLNLDVLTRPLVRRTMTAHFAATGTYFSMLFVVAVHLQQGLGRSPLYSGMALVSWVAAFGVAGPLSARLPAILRWHAAPVAYVILAAAYLALGLAGAGGTAMIVLLGVGGFGLGMGFTAQLGRLTSALPARYAPDVSGLVNTTAQLSAMVGVATFGTLYLAMAGRPAHAFTVVMAAFAATALVAAVSAHAAGRAVGAEVDAGLAAVPGETATPVR